MENAAVTPPRWIEVNIGPVSQRQPEDLLLEVINPLVRGPLARHMKAWFWFWEPASEMGTEGDDEVRLRILWGEPADPQWPESLREALARHQEGGKLAYWYEGNHGVKGGQYEGEAGFYGAEVWEATFRDWMAGSELALTIVKAQHDGSLSKPRAFHWRRRAHLYADQLRRDDAPLCLDQALRYLGREKPSWRTRRLRAAISRYLSRSEVNP